MESVRGFSRIGTSFGLDNIYLYNFTHVLKKTSRLNKEISTQGIDEECAMDAQFLKFP